MANLRAAVVFADLAVTCLLAGVVSQTDKSFVRSIKSRVDAVEQVRLTILKKTSNGIRAQISQLNHRRQFAVHEQWRLDEPRNVDPLCSLGEKLPRQERQSQRSRVVLVLNQHPNRRVFAL